MKYVISVLFLLPLFLMLPLWAAEGPKIALVPLDEPSKTVEELTVASSQELNFVERTAMDKIKAELKLSAADLSKADFNLSPSRMQNADLFGIILDKQFIVYDARTGIRLVDAALPDGSPVSKSMAVARRLANAVKKLNLLRESKVRSLGFIPVVIANLSPEQRQLVHEAERLLIRGTSDFEDSIVLERRYLKFLLEEPNAKENELTKQLWASSIIVRLTAAPAKDGKIKLTANFSVPGRGRVAKAETLLDPSRNLDDQINAFIGRNRLEVQKMPSGGNLEYEAQTFASQAAFAIQHSLLEESVISAETAAALDQARELELCSTYARACSQLWSTWGSAPQEKMPAMLSNFRKALNIAKKHKVFPLSLAHFVDKWGYVSGGTFSGLDPKTQQEIKALFDEYFEARHQGWGEFIESADKGGNNADEKLYALHCRGVYIQCMGQQADQYWNYSYMKMYVLPQLPKYNEEMKSLMPELKKYFALPKDERQKYYPKAAAVDEFNIQERSSTGNLTNRNLFYVTGETKETLTELTNHLQDSPLIHIAIRGAVLKRKMAENTESYEKRAEVNREVYADYTRSVLEMFQTKELIGDFTLNGGLFNLGYECEYMDIDSLLAIWKIAADRFHYYHIFRSNLPLNEKTSFEDAKRLHEAAKTYYARWQSDPQATSKMDYITDGFEEYIARLEKQFPQLNPARKTLPKNPFTHVVAPLDKFSRMKVMGVCYYQEKFYFGVIESQDGSVRLMTCDPANGFAITEGQKLTSKRFSWRGWNINAVIVDGYYVAQVGTEVVLFPLDGSTPFWLDFSEWHNDMINGIWGGGSKIFLSFGKWAGAQTPGTLLQYDLETKETKVLCSTLDTTVRWPLSGMRGLYHVRTGAVDPQKKRFYTTFPEEFPDQNNNFNTCLWAYEWERDEWIRVTDRLPAGDHGSVVFYESGELYLLGSSQNFLRIRAGKKPELLLASSNWRNGNLFSAETWMKDFDLDHSNWVTFPVPDECKPKVNLAHYPGSNIISASFTVEGSRASALLFLKEKFIYQYEDRFSPSLLIWPYAVYWSSYGDNSLKIGVMKDIETLKKEVATLP